MSGPSSKAGRFWSGAGVGLGTGLGAALCLGWWLASGGTLPAPQEPSAEPHGPPAEQERAPPSQVPAAAPDPGVSPPAFSSPPERLVTAREPAVASNAPDDAPVPAMPTAPEVPADAVAEARTLPVVADAAPIAAAPAEQGASQPPSLPEDDWLLAEDAFPLRDQFASLSDALLTDDSTAAPPAPITNAPAPESQSDASSPLASDSWIDVWQPFISPVSARGFADRLELLTGFTYRVQRRPGDGLHQVAVQPVAGYAPEQMLAQIAERSGLAVGPSP